MYSAILFWYEELKDQTSSFASRCSEFLLDFMLDYSDIIFVPFELCSEVLYCTVLL